MADENEDIRSLKSIILYGIKGMAAYAYHARVLGYNDQEVYDFMQKALAAATDSSLTADELLALVRTQVNMLSKPWRCWIRRIHPLTAALKSPG